MRSAQRSDARFTHSATERPRSPNPSAQLHFGRAPTRLCSSTPPTQAQSPRRHRASSGFAPRGSSVFIFFCFVLSAQKPLAFGRSVLRRHIRGKRRTIDRSAFSYEAEGLLAFRWESFLGEVPRSPTTIIPAQASPNTINGNSILVVSFATTQLHDRSTFNLDSIIYHDQSTYSEEQDSPMIH